MSPSMPVSRIVIPGIALLLAVAGAGCSGQSGTPPPSDPTTFIMRGTLTLDGNLVIGRRPGEVFDPAKPVTAGTDCAGAGGYDDIEAGAAVTVFDGDTVIAVGSLEPGEVVSAQASGHSKATGTCRFSFSIANVATGRAFYSVEVSHRGKVNFPADRAEDVSLTLG